MNEDELEKMLKELEKTIEKFYFEEIAKGINMIEAYIKEREEER